MYRILLAVLTAALLFPAAHAVNWYVNSSTGGTRYSAANPNGQCDGKTDTPYPGSGVNRPCPFNEPRLLWTDPYVYADARWVMVSGDNAILETGGQIAGSEDTSAVGKFCFGAGPYCVPPDLPSGVKLLGKNYADCTAIKTFIGARRATLAGDPAKQTFIWASTPSGQTPLYALSVATSKNVTIGCLDVSGQGGRAGNGIFSGNAATPTNTDVTIENVTVHGFADSGWRGNLGGTWTLRNTTFEFNAQAGVNNDPGSNQHSIGPIVASHVSIFGNGCGEEFPITHAFPAVNCKDQNSAGYGDGWGTPVTANLDFSCDHCLVAYNTQDGIDGGHIVASKFSITNSEMYGNMGGNLKSGPNANIFFSNNIIDANCRRMHDSIPGSIPGFNQQLSLWCRSGDQNSMTALSTATLNTKGTISSVVARSRARAATGTITGTGTSFLSDYAVGDVILPGDAANAFAYDTWHRTITAVESNTSMLIDTPFPSNISNEYVVKIPPGGASSKAVMDVEFSDFIGYGPTVWDVPCQTGDPQVTIDQKLCNGLTYRFHNNITHGYSEVAFNEGQSPGMWYFLIPTDEDYNIFVGLRNPAGTGPHDKHESPQFVDQPASPITDETELDVYNYDLDSTSPAIGAGIASARTPLDLAGNRRPNPPSMGALEPAATPPTPTPRKIRVRVEGGVLDLTILPPETKR